MLPGTVVVVVETGTVVEVEVVLVVVGVVVDVVEVVVVEVVGTTVVDVVVEVVGATVVDVVVEVVELVVLVDVVVIAVVVGASVVEVGPVVEVLDVGTDVDVDVDVGDVVVVVVEVDVGPLVVVVDASEGEWSTSNTILPGTHAPRYTVPHSASTARCDKPSAPVSTCTPGDRNNNTPVTNLPVVSFFTEIDPVAVPNGPDTSAATVNTSPDADVNDADPLNPFNDPSAARSIPNRDSTSPAADHTRAPVTLTDTC